VGQGLQLLRKLGTYVEYSVFGSDVTVDWSIISDDKELDVLGAHLGPHCWPAAGRMLESGRLPLAEIVAHQLPLSESQQGLDLVGDDTASIKVSLLPGGWSRLADPAQWAAWSRQVIGSARSSWRCSP
jgi:erythritol/L-threitol dehydrogenase